MEYPVTPYHQTNSKVSHMHTSEFKALKETMKKNAPSAPLTIGKYLLDSLASHGVGHIFGIPGDYVIRFDKLIEEHSIRFINTTREDSAGYMADAYARVKGLGVACITYGVGIPIINPTAQAYVENSPVVIISGAASNAEFSKQPTLHHLINKSSNLYRDTTQLEIFKQVTIDQAVLDDSATAKMHIDRVLDSCLTYKKPVYIEIPRDQVDAPLSHEQRFAFHSEALHESDTKALKEALHEASERLKTAKRPIIWMGRDIQVHQVADTVLQFAEKFQIPMVSSLLGKAVIDEHHPLFLGIYQGKMSREEVQSAVEASDCAFILGVLMSDVDTGFLTTSSDSTKQIVATPYEIKIGHHYYPKVTFKDFIGGLTQFQPSHAPTISVHKPPLPAFKAEKDKKITTARLFDCLQKHITLKHTLVSDIGDCLFASGDLVLGKNGFIAGAYFASLGSGVPMAIGAQFAGESRRIIAVVGDGGFQMSGIELSTAVRYEQSPIIILLNNHGYGTERPLIEGEFNNLLNWNYTALPQLLGQGHAIRATTEEGFEEALKEAIASKVPHFTLIEVELDKMDFSPALKRFGKFAKEKV